MVTSQRAGADNRAGGGKRKAGASRVPERPGGPVLYNFRRPDKFSKDHIRSIQSIQESYSRFVTNYLASSIRSAVHVELAHAEQSTFGEFIDQLPNPTVLFSSELEPLRGNVLIQIDRSLALMIVDRLLGGPGVAKVERGGANVTEIEMLLLEDLGKGLFQEFTNAWEQVTNLQSSRCDVILSSQQVQGAMPSEVALVIRHDLRLFNSKGKMTICLPASTIEPLMPRLNARLLFANPRSGPGSEIEDDLAAQLASASLTMSVEIGKTTVRVSDLFALEVGDIIRLDSAAYSPLAVRVEDRETFLAQPGQKNGQLAVRIIDYADDLATFAEAEGESHSEWQ